MADNQFLILLSTANFDSSILGYNHDFTLGELEVFAIYECMIQGMVNDGSVVIIGTTGSDPSFWNTDTYNTRLWYIPQFIVYTIETNGPVLLLQRDVDTTNNDGHH